MALPTTLDDVESDDVLFVSASNDPNNWTVTDKWSIRTYLEEKLYDLNLDVIRTIVLNSNTWQNDDVLDVFIGVIRENSNVEIESVVYINYPYCVEPAKTLKSAMILGGSCTKHW